MSRVPLGSAWRPGSGSTLGFDDSRLPAEARSASVSGSPAPFKAQSETRKSKTENRRGKEEQGSAPEAHPPAAEIPVSRSKKIETRKSKIEKRKAKNGERDWPAAGRVSLDCAPFGEPPQDKRDLRCASTIPASRSKKIENRKSKIGIRGPACRRQGCRSTKAPSSNPC